MKGILISLVVSQAVCEPIARARAVEEILGLAIMGDLFIYNDFLKC